MLTGSQSKQKIRKKHNFLDKNAVFLASP